MQRLLTLLLSAAAFSGCIHFAAEIATNRFRREAPVRPELKTPSVAEQNAAWCRVHDCATPPGPVNVLIDTHAHLSMGPGMGPFFEGKPWEIERPAVWSDRFAEKMAVDKIKESGLRLIVVSLYANVFAIWPKDPYTAIYEEIEQTHELVRRYPDLFTIATTSEQARRAIAAGKIALQLHLEGGEWVMRSQEDVAALYRAGVRAVNPAHLYDSWIGGSDLQAGGRKLLNPPGWAHSHDVGGHRENKAGLTEDGKRLFRTLRDYGYIVDISHLSRVSIRDLAAMPEFAATPIFNSHMPDLYFSTPSERGVDEEAFRILRERNGLLGLVPTAHSPEVLDAFGDACPGTIETFAVMYAETLKMAQGMPIALASDFNGGIGHLKPTHGPDGCREATGETDEFQRQGMADAGAIPHVLRALEARGVDITPLYASSERYLQIWEGVEKLKKF